MRIRRLEVDGFGVWSGLALDEMSSGVNVFYGPNETGKSTLLQFMRGVLYGYTPERRAYFPPVHGGRPGGSLHVVGTSGRFQIARYDDATAGPRGDLALTAADGTRHGEHFLKVILSEVDERVFNNVFAVGLQEMQELATLSDTEAAELLYSLTAGLDRVSLVDVIRAIETSRNGILSARGEPCQVTQLIAQRDDLRTQIEELRQGSRRFGRLAAERDQFQREIDRLETEHHRLARDLRVVEIAMAVRDPWRQRAELDRHLAGVAAAPRVPEGIVSQLDAIQARQKRHQGLLGEVRQRSKRLRGELADVRVNEALWRQSARIEALREQQGWLKGLQEQVAGLEQELTTARSEIGGQYKQLGLPTGTATNSLPPKVLAALRSAAKAMRRTGKESTALQQKAQETASAAEALSTQVEQAMAAHGEKELSPALERTSAEVAQLRERLAIDDRLTELARYQEELEQQSRDLLAREMLPLRVLMTLGAMFMLGVVLIAVWWLVPVAVLGSLGWVLGILGLGGIVAAVATKFIADRNNAQQLAACQKQADMVRVEMRQVKQERERLDRAIPRGNGPLSLRLEKAQQLLAALEEVVPLDARRQASAQEAAAASQQAERARAEASAARRRWRESLVAAQLPEDFAPRQLRIWLHRGQHLQDQQQRLTHREEELKHRRSEHDALATRIMQMLVDCGLESKETDPQRQLQVLVDSMKEQEARAKRREELLRQARRWKRRRLRYEKSLRRARSQRRRVLREAGLQSEQQLHELLDRQAQLDRQRQQREAIQREINAAIGGFCDEATVERQLQNPTRLEILRDELAASTAALERQLQERFELRGGLAQQMTVLADDRALADRRLELASVEKRLEDAIARWQVQAVTSRLLEEVRRSYEQERQPEALQEASGYLARLTCGRYRRVWTPLDERSLRVDDEEGRSRAVEQLSRGTREQLFLALRMALVGAFGRQGKVLPMVLDDVLVNFDTQRAKAAAELLIDYAQAGHQLLVFTCHEHIFEMFSGENVSLHRLLEGGRVQSVLESPPKLAPVVAEEAPPKRRRRRAKAKEERIPVVAEAEPPEPEAAPVATLEEQPWDEEEDFEEGLWDESSDDPPLDAGDDDVEAA